MRETYEIGVSALLDAELGHSELLEVVDRMVEDPDLRDFYRQVRGLDVDLLVSGLAQPLPAAPAGLWNRIESDALLEPPGGTVIEARRRFGRLPSWMLASAAAAVVVLGVLWVGNAQRSPVLAEGFESGDIVNIQLAADAGAMDDDRFVELTAELLRADRRYHRAMEQIVSAVNARGPAAEGNMEGFAPLNDFQDSIRPAGFSRVGPGGDDQRVWD